MKIISVLTLSFLSFSRCVMAQSDSTRLLEEVIVNAYQSNRPVSEVAAAIGVMNEKELSRFANSSLLPAANTIPGVRMEERSPGSYRFSIRGSSLRSPFGVRNVKFYWNGLPLTDGGGNTYLNLLDFNSIGSMEIIKGPGASLYGAGTGGVVLLESPDIKHDQLQLAAVAGSYGLQQYHVSASIHKENWDATLKSTLQQADGYREQSEMNRRSTHLDINCTVNENNILSATFFTSRLNYETPGGLNQAQYDENARQARPATSTTPGAVDQQAAVENLTTYMGLSHEVQWSSNLSTRTGFYGSVTDFNNPTIRNYEIRDEKNGGMRTATRYTLDKDMWKAMFTAGAELQFFKSDVSVYGNDKGTKTTLQTLDELNAQQYLLFAQSEIDLPYQFYLTIGASWNELNYTDQQSVTAFNLLRKKFDADISPRIALLKKINSSISVYTNISRGFSPPTFAEALPSSGVFNPDLTAERGVSYEAGLRGTLFADLEYDVAVYDFQLKEAIVIQRAADGAEYFVNAGSTSQKGIEGRLSWNKTMDNQWINNLHIWSSTTVNHYRFKRYEQSGVDYSGNTLTGVAPTIIIAGLDIYSKAGLYLNVNVNYTDHISLSDAAAQYASDFVLLGARAGLRKNTGKRSYDFFCGMDNALNQKYSLGNDLNAIGGRYYNVAPGRNFYGGLKIGLR